MILFQKKNFFWGGGLDIEYEKNSKTHCLRRVSLFGGMEWNVKLSIEHVQ